MKRVLRMIDDATADLYEAGCDTISFVAQPFDFGARWGCAVEFTLQGEKKTHRNGIRLPLGDYTEETALIAGIPALVGWVKKELAA